jgi:predicted DNA-binding transcriptional regulator AlpA
MKLVRYIDLKPVYGIHYSRVHLYRLELKGEFPKRIPVSEKRVAWLDDEIALWIKQRMAGRDS